MTKPTHTPTPWERTMDMIHQDCDFGKRAVVICDMNKLDNWQANANHIVHCVNAHEKLVADNKVMREALEMCDSAIMRLEQIQQPTEKHIEIWAEDGKKFIRKALANCKESE